MALPTTFADAIARVDAYPRGPEAQLLATLMAGLIQDGSAFQVPIKPPPSGSLTVGSAAKDAVGAQRSFWAGSGRLTIAAAGNFRATLANPAGSGRNLHVEKLVVFSTVRDWVNLYINPTTGLPVTAARIANNAVLGAAAGVGVYKADTDTVTPLGGGTDTQVVFGSGPDDMGVVELPPFVVPPGTTLGLNSNVAAAAEANINLFWYENDV